MTLVRAAMMQDAPTMAQVYRDAWVDAYPGLLPDRVLLGLSLDRLQTMWESQIRQSSSVGGALVAETDAGTILGVASFGLNRDTELPFRGEVFTLYVDPAHLGKGIGSALLNSMLRRMSDAGVNSALVWTLSLNPSRFFYEACGAKPIARKVEHRWDTALEQTAYGWPDIRLVAIATSQDDVPRG